MVVGETVMGFAPPVFQVYVVPPLAVRVILLPLQIGALPLILAVGKGLTVTSVVVEAVQLLLSVTVTV